MNKKKNDISQQKLDEFLKKSAENEPIGDFEKEALEGFALLENEQAALDLKQELDEQVYPQLFSEKKANTKNSRWLAAAGLFLVIGFSVYLLVDFNKSKSNQLALTTTKTPEQQAKPEQINHLAPEISESKSNNNTEPATGRDTKKSKTSATADKKEKKANTQPETEINRNNTRVAPELALTSAAEAAATGALPATAVNNPIQPVEKNSNTASNTMAVPAAAPASEAFAAADVMVEKKSAPQGAAPRAMMAKSSACIYDHGAEAFHNDVKKLLSQAGLDRKCAGYLIISPEGSVIDAVLTEYSAFSNNELNKVKDFLKSLAKFRNVDNATGTCKYHFDYKP